MKIEKIIDHIRNRPYMSGVERSEQRKLQFQEVFTTEELTKLGFDNLNNDYFKNPNQIFVDPCCGDGTLLGEALIRKCQNGIDFETALKSLRGVDINESNIKACHERLLVGQDQFKPIVEQYIIVGNALEDEMLWGEEKSFGPNDLFTIEPSKNAKN